MWWGRDGGTGPRQLPEGFLGVGGGIGRGNGGGVDPDSRILLGWGRGRGGGAPDPESRYSPLRPGVSPTLWDYARLWPWDRGCLPAPLCLAPVLGSASGLWWALKKEGCEGEVRAWVSFRALWWQAQWQTPAFCLSGEGRGKPVASSSLVSLRESRDQAASSWCPAPGSLVSLHPSHSGCGLPGVTGRVLSSYPPHRGWRESWELPR